VAMPRANPISGSELAKFKVSSKTMTAVLDQVNAGRMAAMAEPATAKTATR